MAVLALLLPVACADDRAPIESCADRLFGVWNVDGSDHRYHALDTGRTVELHPLFDSAESNVHRGAAAFMFSRTPEGIKGSYAFWVTGPNRLRRTRWQAELRQCAGDHITVAYRRDAADWVELSLTAAAQ